MAKFNARCPGCRGKFPWDPKLGLPTHCPLPRCSYTTVESEEIVIAAPFIRSARMKATDDCYRQLEQSSEVRAQLAADAAGVPVSEMSHLKVTNIRDDTRPGEIAAMPVRNVVTEQMAVMQARGMPVGFGVGSADTHPGKATGYAGAKAMDSVQRLFNR